MHPPYQYFDHGSRQKLALHPVLSDRCSLAPKAHRNLAARLLTQWILTSWGRRLQEKSQNSEPKKLGGRLLQGPLGGKPWKNPGRPIQMAGAICHRRPSYFGAIIRLCELHQVRTVGLVASRTQPGADHLHSIPEKWVLKVEVQLSITGRTPRYPKLLPVCIGKIINQWMTIFFWRISTVSTRHRPWDEARKLDVLALTGRD